MSTAQLSEFLKAVNSNPELAQTLQSEGANPIEIAYQAGYSIDQNDLITLKTSVNALENSSPELHSFLQVLVQRPELQTRLQQPGNDPLAIANELGIKLSEDELSKLFPEAVELDDAALDQVVGGTFLAELGGLLLFGLNVTMYASAAVAVVGGIGLAGLAVAGGVTAYYALKD